MKLLIVILAAVGASMAGETRTKRGFLGGSAVYAAGLPSVHSEPSVVSVPKVVSVASSPYVGLHSYSYAQPALHSYSYAQPALHYSYPSLYAAPAYAAHAYTAPAYAAAAYAAPWW